MKTNMTLEIPTTIRHFHKPSGRLIATVAALELTPDTVAVGIARCNKKDRPSRAVGRELAILRLLGGLGFQEDREDKVSITKESKLNLFKIMPKDEFDHLLKVNPFKDWGCPFGTSSESLKKLKKTKKTKKGKK